ncbi:hypothetical protein JOQ06_017796 [Pogonophryne albipinna]|uniref:Death-associated protein 1 n=1 Tax=Pogonophryne albipinna TaxID=1090488 RepID=A0AAD6AHV3_9TELE|nr:hypothetical protein JOQ06_017796 [Pogonophryne albipinna]
MSSPPKEKMEKVETKGGHLPAVKAGGMRIVQKHQPVAAAAPEPVDTYLGFRIPPPHLFLCLHSFPFSMSDPPKVPVIVSGVVTKGDKDFTPAAAQVAHQKPQPCVSKLPASQHINQPIHQPRK